MHSYHRQSQVKGYYSLSSTSIDSNHLPQTVLKKLPKRKTQPCTLLGKLAVDQSLQRSGQGELLLVDALRRSYNVSTQVGSFAVVVDALNHNIVHFYKKFEFISLKQERMFFLPMKTIEKLFI